NVFDREKQVVAMPVTAHQTAGGMGTGTEQEMAQFMRRNDSQQNCRIQLGLVLNSHHTLTKNVRLEPYAVFCQVGHAESIAVQMKGMTNQTQMQVCGKPAVGAIGPLHLARCGPSAV